jgi:hypothetical protein
MKADEVFHIDHSLWDAFTFINYVVHKVFPNLSYRNLRILEVSMVRTRGDLDSSAYSQHFTTRRL